MFVCVRAGGRLCTRARVCVCECERDRERDNFSLRKTIEAIFQKDREEICCWPKISQLRLTDFLKSFSMEQRPRDENIRLIF